MNQQLVVVWVVLAVAQVVYLIYPAPHREGDAVPSDVFAAALGAVAVVQSIGIVILLRVRAFNPVRTVAWIRRPRAAMSSSSRPCSWPGSSA